MKWESGWVFSLVSGVGILVVLGSQSIVPLLIPYSHMSFGRKGPHRNPRNPRPNL